MTFSPFFFLARVLGFSSSSSNAPSSKALMFSLAFSALINRYGSAALKLLAKKEGSEVEDVSEFVRSI